MTAYRFPLRNVLVWLLVLPLAMPAYILGFVFLSTFDVSGPVQSALRSLFGADVWVPDVRSLPGAIIVMTLTLYPYVYLLARNALVEQAPGTYDAARTLGAGRGRALRKVLLPLARPSLAAGLSLVMMETLTDFATVQYFNVKTVSVGVYLVGKGSFDFHSATQLSVLVLLFAVAVLAGERLMRGRARFHQKSGRGQGLQAEQLSGWKGWGAALLGVLALATGFVIPVVQLLIWAFGDMRGWIEALRKGNAAAAQSLALPLYYALAAAWLRGSNEYTGNTGVWAQISVDEELGLAYLPVDPGAAAELRASAGASAQAAERHRVITRDRRPHAHPARQPGDLLGLDLHAQLVGLAGHQTGGDQVGEQGRPDDRAGRPQAARCLESNEEPRL